MKRIARAITQISLDHPKSVIGIMLTLTLGLATLALLPTVWPDAFPGLSGVTVDVDPENMLSPQEEVRQRHHEVRERFNLHDGMVLGVVNEAHPDGVFNPETLKRVHQLTEFAKGIDGVISVDIMAPGTLDSMENAGPGTVAFDWLMATPPTTREGALAVRDRAMRISFLKDTLVSGDEKAIALYLPLVRKDIAHRVSVALQAEIDGLGDVGEDAFHIAGLPVAEDTFGVEMFTQMAISAPAAMLVIFALMWLFFRRLVVIVSPMIVAMVAAIITMALLVVTGNTVHIMSSMIPIFIMPIAVLDAVHIISDFFDRYPESKDRKATILHVMEDLFAPMLYTSLTTTAGFGSLALTPIPPVQVFGLFVAIGVMMAWLWTITFIPAFISLLSERRLEGFGRSADSYDGETNEGALGVRFGQFTYRRARTVLVGTLALSAVAAWGVTQINVNDNPTRWFEADHPIRVADRVLNGHFAGTYDAYMSLKYDAPAYSPEGYAGRLTEAAAARAEGVQAAMTAFNAEVERATGEDALAVIEGLETAARAARQASADAAIRAGYVRIAQTLGDLYAEAEEAADEAPTGEGEEAAPAAAPAFEIGAYRQQIKAALAAQGQAYAASAEALKGAIQAVAASGPADQAAFLAALGAQGPEGITEGFIAAARQLDEVFKRPEILAWISDLQVAMAETGVIGKSSALPDVVRTVHRDLLSGHSRDLRIPATSDMVAQTLDQFTSSHRKDDLWHFVTPDYQQALIWAQLKSGDNQDMARAVAQVDAWLAEHPAPMGLETPKWSGLTYINVVWQEKMVTGMLEALLGSFVVVLLMMIVLFRSVLWGILSMVPLTVTIGFIYGLLGIVGKDYDMPVAVLSSLSLGLAVDYAIHFLARARQLHDKYGSWYDARRAVFQEPARAIARNVVVVGLGFTPLLLAPLVPYQTVGILIAGILIAAGGTSLIILPALITLMERWLFPAKPSAEPQPNHESAPQAH